MRELPAVLVIGDDVDRLTRLREILRRGAVVSQAEDLPQALSRMARERFDVAFTDWQFHCGTWRDVLQKLHALYPDLPVIVVSQTTRIDEGIREWAEAVSAGAFDLLLSANSASALLLLEHAVASGDARALRATA
jgi:DNA-binding NtrC family response regulator